MEDKHKITEEDDEIDVLYRLNEYADCNPDFCCKLLDSCDDQFRNKGYLYLTQIKALDSIWYEISKSHPRRIQIND
jgi:hypothetical protein